MDGIFHSPRYPNGTWSGWGKIGAPDPRTGTGYDVAIAATADGKWAHVVTNTHNGILHQTRDVGGSWSGWRYLHTGFTVEHVAIAAMPDGSVQVLVTRAGDKLVFMNVRYPDGNWSGWQQMGGYGGASGFAADQISITGLANSSSQVVATEPASGAVYHIERYPDGNWSPWAPMGFNAERISITNSTNLSTHVVAAARGTNQLFHRIRFGNGQWTPFGLMPGRSGSTGGFLARDVAVAGLTNGAVHVMASEYFDRR